VWQRAVILSWFATLVRLRSHLLGGSWPPRSETSESCRDESPVPSANFAEAFLFMPDAVGKSVAPGRRLRRVFHREPRVRLAGRAGHRGRRFPRRARRAGNPLERSRGRFGRAPAWSNTAGALVRERRIPLATWWLWPEPKQPASARRWGQLRRWKTNTSAGCPGEAARLQRSLAWRDIRASLWLALFIAARRLRERFCRVCCAGRPQPR